MLGALQSGSIGAVHYMLYPLLSVVVSCQGNNEEVHTAINALLRLLVEKEQLPPPYPLMHWRHSLPQGEGEGQASISHHWGQEGWLVYKAVSVSTQLKVIQLNGV